MKSDLTDIELEVIADYDQVLIGNLRNIDPFYFANKTQEANQATALMVIQYAVENYLKWSPQKMYASLTIDVMNKWRLTPLLKYVQFPVDLNKEKYVRYLACMIYPNVIACNEMDMCLEAYQRALEDRTRKMPKDFYRGPRAMDYICACLHYLIDNYTNFKSLEEAYEFFGTTKCLKFLRDYKLCSYIKEQFEAPIVPFYVQCPKEQQIPLLFHYYRFWTVFADAMEQGNAMRELRAALRADNRNRVNGGIRRA